MKNLLIRLTFMMLLTLFVDSVFSQSCPSGMVAYWKLEETSGTTFDDAYGTNNALSDLPLFTDPSGIMGNAVIIDSNTVDIAANAVFNFGANSSFSIELWAKFTEAWIDKGGYANHIIIGRGDPYVSGTYWAIGVDKSARINFDLRDADGVVQSITSTASYAGAGWLHIVAVRNETAGNITLYVNNAPVATTNVNYNGSFSSSSHVSIGYLFRNGDPGYFYYGGVDEVAIYNRALTTTEIGTHYSNTPQGVGYCDPIYPQIVSTPDNTASVGSLYTYQVHATGIKSTMTYSLITKPTGMNITTVNGLGNITWTPSTANVNAFVQVVANNNNAPADTQSYTIFLNDAPVCPTNMMLLLKLNEKSGSTYADTKGAHNGTALVAPTPVAGIIGSGAQAFNAGSKTAIAIPDNGTEFDWAYNASFTLELWVKTTTSGEMVFLTRNRIDYPNIALWVLGSDAASHASFELRDNGSHYKHISGTTALNDGNWHYIVAVRNASAGTNILYVDGAEEANEAMSYSNSFEADNPTEWNLGYIHRDDPSANGYYFTGSIDEVAIYNRALSSTEISGYWNNGVPVAHCPEGNYYPIITSTPITAASQDVSYSYTFKVDDYETTPLTLSAPTKPAWLNFNWTSGQKSATLTGTPLGENVGNHNVVLRVHDGTVQRDQSFTISVANVNDPPVVTSTPVTSVNENAAYSYTLTITDADASDPITMTVITKPSWLNFTWISGSKTATLSGTPNDTDAGGTVTVNIYDGTVTVPHTYTLTVVPVNDPPVISAQSALSIDEDNPITLQKSNFTITDIDNPGSDLTLKVLAGTNYTFAGTTVTPAANFNGMLTVNTVVSDLNADSQPFGTQVTVNSINDPPVITSVPIENIYIGNLYAYVFTASDPDNATLTKSTVSLPAWLQFSAANGVLTGTPVQANVGQHLILLRVSDGTVNVDQSFVLTVDGPNALIREFEAEGIRVFPVPARDNLTVQFDNLSEEAQLELISPIGSIVKKVAVPANQLSYNLSLNGIEAGTYLLHISNGKLNSIGRIVIE